MTYPLVHDGPGKVLSSYGVTGVPETLFINRRGHLVGDVSRAINHDGDSALDRNIRLRTAVVRRAALVAGAARGGALRRLRANSTRPWPSSRPAHLPHLPHDARPVGCAGREPDPRVHPRADRRGRHEEPDQAEARRAVRARDPRGAAASSGFDLLAWLLPLAGLAAGGVVARRARLALEPRRAEPDGRTARRAAGRARPRPRAAARRGARPLRRVGAVDGRPHPGRVPRRVRLVHHAVRAAARARLPLDGLGGRGRRGSASAASARRIVVASLPFIARVHRRLRRCSARLRRRSASVAHRDARREIAGFVARRLRARVHRAAPVAGAVVAPRLLGGAPRRGSSAAPRRRLRGVRRAVHRPGARRGARPRQRRGHGRAAARSCSPSTRSGSPAPSCSPAWRSPARWARSAGSATATSDPSAGGAVLVALGLLLFFGRFWWLRVGSTGPGADRTRRLDRGGRARAPASTSAARLDRSSTPATSTPRCAGAYGRGAARPSRAGARSRRVGRGRPGTRRPRRGRAPGRSRAPPAARRARRVSSASCASKYSPAPHQLEALRACPRSSWRSIRRPARVTLGRGDDPAGGGRPLLPGEARSAAAGAPLRHDRHVDAARSRDRRHRADRRRRRSRTPIRTSRSSASRTTRTPPGCARRTPPASIRSSRNRRSYERRQHSSTSCSPR